MAEIHLKLRFDSPAFLNGSDPRGSPEFRVASIRGQLRYWARAIIGARTTALKDVWEQESAAFGSTGQGAPVMVRLGRVYPADKYKKSVAMLPHRQYSGGNVSKMTAIVEETPFVMACLTRPAVMMPNLFEQALAVWLLLGGVGKRSRRMFGSPGIREVAGFSDATLAQALQSWQSVEELRSAIKTVLHATIGAGSTMPRSPAFPTLHPTYSRIVVGNRGFDDAEEANKALFGLLRDNKKPYRDVSERYFGNARNGRRASPLIAQVRRIGDKCYPVLTYLVSDDLRDLGIVNQFMTEAEKSFGGQTVWGGPFA